VSLATQVQEHGGEVAWRQALFFNVEHAEKAVLRSGLIFRNGVPYWGSIIGMEEVK
jgi:hypothetical protein